MGATPTFREYNTGSTGSVITLSGSCVVANQLLAFRNGVLMYQSSVLDAPAGRYTLSLPSEVNLGADAVITDFFEFIYI